MNAESNSGTEPETRTPPTTEAGCEGEIDRNVLGTVASTGFAELRARCRQARRDAFKHYYGVIFQTTSGTCESHRGRCEAFDEVIAWIDDLEADAKSGS
jgi:hypothetical protein